MSGYVIRFYASTDFYAGKMYTCQGERFPCYCKKEEAKVYKSREIAESVARSIGGNGGTPKVEPLGGKKDA